MKGGRYRVPTVMQQVHDPVVSAEAPIRSLAPCSAVGSGSKLTQLWRSSQIWLGFRPWPGNFHKPWVWQKKEKKKKEIKREKKSDCLNRLSTSCLVKVTSCPHQPLLGMLVSRLLREEHCTKG